MKENNVVTSETKDALTPVRDKKQFVKKLVVSQIFCTFTGEFQQVTNIFDMTTDYKVTELFCIIDEFCKHFEAENAGNLLEDNSVYGHPGSKTYKKLHSPRTEPPFGKT